MINKQHAFGQKFFTHLYDFLLLFLIKKKTKLHRLEVNNRVFLGKVSFSLTTSYILHKYVH